MTLRHLRIFVAVYQERSITRAADRLHLAQPSVSLAIRELEENYKIRLFERFSRRLFITEQGEQLYDYALHIISLFDEMEENAYKGGKIIISHCFNNEKVQYIEKTIKEKFPQSQIEIMPTGGLCSYYAEQGGIIVAFES